MWKIWYLCFFVIKNVIKISFEGDFVLFVVFISLFRVWKFVWFVVFIILVNIVLDVEIKRKKFYVRIWLVVVICIEEYLYVKNNCD